MYTIIYTYIQKLNPKTGGNCVYKIHQLYTYKIL